MFLASRSSAGGFQSLFRASTPTLPPTPNNQCYFMVFQALLWYACIKKTNWWLKILSQTSLQYVILQPWQLILFICHKLLLRTRIIHILQIQKRKNKECNNEAAWMNHCCYFCATVSHNGLGWYKTAAPTPVCAFRASVIDGASLPGRRSFDPTGMSARCFTTHCFRLHLLTAFVQLGRLLERSSGYLCAPMYFTW